MTDVLKPRDGKDVEEAVRWALAGEKPLEIAGHGTKRTIGRPSQTDLTLDLSGLAGVTLYEPAELVLSARAGTPISEIEVLLDKHNQELAFEPIDYGPLLGAEANNGTIGGVIAANLSGPRRIKAGAARDHFLGVTAVTGRGETIKSGGRVVKNVTGYDLCKVLAGSWGTLAAMTDVTVKVLPKSETEATVVVSGLDDARAAEAMSAAIGSPHDVSAAAHLPDHVVSWFDGLPNAEAATVLRIEGFAPSIAHRKEALAGLMRPFGAVAILDPGESRALWRAVGEVRPFAVDAAPRRAECRLDPPRRRRSRRPRHADPRAGIGARRGRGVRAGSGPHRGAEQAGQGQLRSERRAQSRPHVGGGIEWLGVPPLDFSRARRNTQCCGADPGSYQRP